MTTGYDLSGRVALVTGAGSFGGIGEATARVLGEAGARVVIADLASSSLGDVRDALCAEGLDVLDHVVDIADQESVAELVSFTTGSFGTIDILDNNASASGLVPFERDLISCPTDLWDGIFAVVSRGTMLMCKHTIPVMRAQRRGSIINISSGKSLAGNNDQAAYSAAKSAVNSLSRSIAVMYGKHGIRCNTISPGVITTSLMERVVPPRMAALMRENVLTPELGAPRDIASLVLFLASDRSAYLTGQLIPCDGGWGQHSPTYADNRST